MIAITCPTCRERSRIAVPSAGREVRCPVCGATFVLPAAKPPPLPTSQQPRKVLPIASPIRGPGLSRDTKAGWRRRIVLLTLALVGAVVLVWWNKPDAANPISTFFHNVAVRLGWSKSAVTYTPMSSQSGNGIVVRADRAGQDSSGAATHASPPTSPDGHFIRDRIGLVMLERAEYPDKRDQIVAVSKQGQRVAVKRVVDGGRVIVMAADEPIASGASTAPGAPGSAGFVGPRYAGQGLFSPDGKHLAWVANLGAGDRQAVVLDGKMGQEFATVRTLAFRPDLSCFTFIAQKADKIWRGMILLNGLEQEMSGPVSPGAVSIPATRAAGDAIADGNDSVVRSQGGAHQARIVPTTRPDDDASVVEVDGIKDRPVTGSITDLQFSPDGLHYIYLVHAPGDRETVSLVVDGIDLNRPLFGKCYGLGFVLPDTLGLVLGSPDGTLRLMELRLVAARGTGGPPVPRNP